MSKELDTDINKTINNKILDLESKLIKIREEIKADLKMLNSKKKEETLLSYEIVKLKDEINIGDILVLDDCWFFYIFKVKTIISNFGDGEFCLEMESLEDPNHNIIIYRPKYGFKLNTVSKDKLNMLPKECKDILEGRLSVNESYIRINKEFIKKPAIPFQKGNTNGG